MELTLRIVEAAGYNWWDLVPAGVGGVIGALAGGLVAWLLAKRSSKETLERDKEARTEAELTAAFRLFTKLSVMNNELLSTLIQLREMLQRPVDPGVECPTQMRISAFAGCPEYPELQLTAEDLYVLVAANETDYMSDLDLFARRFSANMRTLRIYGEKKEQHSQTIMDAEDIRFGPNDAVMTPARGPVANKLRLQARDLEAIIVPLIHQMEENAAFGVGLAMQFGPKLKAHFKDRKVPGFDFSPLKERLPDLFPGEQADSGPPSN